MSDATHDRQPNQPLLLRLSNSKFFYLFLLAVGIPSAFVGLVSPIIDAFTSRHYVAGSVFVLFLVGTVLVGFLTYPRSRSTPPPRRRHFQGVSVDLTASQAWPRATETEAILHATQTWRGPILVSGPSGAGKSVLLRSFIRPALESRGYKVFQLNQYTMLREELFNRLASHFHGLTEKNLQQGILAPPLHPIAKIAVIFDQFEQFVSNTATNSETDIALRKWFATFVANTVADQHLHIIIAVRKECYYELRFLGALLPPPHLCLDVSGLSLSPGSPVRSLLLEKLFQVTGDKWCAAAVLRDLAADGPVSPVEAQIVGLMLENADDQPTTISEDDYLNALGGRQGLIDRYFKAYVLSAPDHDTAVKVLFSLSLNTSSGSGMSASEVACITHESTAPIRKCLNFLEAQGLVVTTEGRNYAFAHDYLAEQFHAFSASTLEPAERDNIVHFWNTVRHNGNNCPITQRRHEVEMRLVFSDYCLAFLVVLLFARLLIPLFDPGLAGYGMPAHGHYRSSFIDFCFLPVFVAHLAWSIYVMMFYRNFLCHLDEHPLERLLSIATVVMCCLCVLTAALAPYLWICSIGAGGFVVGVKLYQLVPKPTISTPASLFFRRRGLRTMANSLIIIAVGLVEVSYVSSLPFEEVMSSAYFISAVLTYFMISVRGTHITRNASTLMLGLVDRGRAVGV